MKVLAVRSVPLSKETRDAWSSAGVKFVRRDRDVDAIGRVVVRGNYDTILNLGNTTIHSRMGVPVWNDNGVVRAVSRTDRLRLTLDGFGMPEANDQVAHWHKNGGWGGEGVVFHPYRLGGGCSAFFRETQAHIEGTEYRVITVGDKVVQATRKVNLEWVNNRHRFDWEWCGVEGVSRNGIIPLLKHAVELIPNWEFTVLGWDVIVGENGPYIIESNTSPGVNEATARRIVNAMEERMMDNGS